MGVDAASGPEIEVTGRVQCLDSMPGGSWVSGGKSTGAMMWPSISTPMRGKFVLACLFDVGEFRVYMSGSLSGATNDSK
ncbi:hypothetical protein SAMN04488238_10684 [Roseicitreum antarcticum]|uniref:Uncharacterized protein n=1 Tax=Roseicitreum antarcticum TaxID=564137 RepID=A0A1H2ZX36_9RHOB|nr:hypothetical protein SAMN04488238_10684 [Roseicitreum antarcticum]